MLVAVKIVRSDKVANMTEQERRNQQIGGAPMQQGFQPSGIAQNIGAIAGSAVDAYGRMGRHVVDVGKDIYGGAVGAATDVMTGFSPPDPRQPWQDKVRGIGGGFTGESPMSPFITPSIPSGAKAQQQPLGIGHRQDGQPGVSTYADQQPLGRVDYSGSHVERMPDETYHGGGRLPPGIQRDPGFNSYSGIGTIPAGEPAANPANPFGRSDAVQQQIQANVAGINRQTSALKEANDLREGIVRGPGEHQSGISILGEEGYGSGYGPGGVGDDGSGDFYRKKAMEALKAGSTKEAAQYGALAKERDTQQRGVMGIEQGRQVGREKRAQEQSQFEAQQAQQQQQFGVEQAGAQRGLDIEQYKAERPGQTSQALEYGYKPGTPGYELYDAEGRPSYVPPTSAQIFSKRTGLPGPSAQQSGNVKSLTSPQGVIAAVNSGQLSEEEGKRLMAGFKGVKTK